MDPDINLLLFVFQINLTKLDIRLGVAIFGIVGNLLMLFVYSRKNMRKITVSTYFRVIAVVNLLMNVANIIIYVFAKILYDMYDSTEFSCKFVHYLFALPGPISF